MAAKRIECKLLEEIRKNRKLTNEKIRRISEIAREELQFLVRNNIPLLPENFYLWFEIFCYLKEKNKKFTDLELLGFFKELYPTPADIEEALIYLECRDKEILKNISKELHNEIKHSLECLERCDKNLEEREKFLETVKRNFKDSELVETLDEILFNVREIRKQNEFLKRKLQEANEKIRELTKELHEIKLEASIDFLTQVANRASFDRALSDMVRDYYERNYPFALILIDIDDFKKINDTYGHQAGDYVLRELARVLKSQLRARDIIARYGGEEFAIILPGVTFSQAIKVAERLRKSVEKHLFKYKGKEIPVTVSVGVAMMRDGLDETSIVEKADKALYLAKRSGKNQTKTDLEVELEG